MSALSVPTAADVNATNRRAFEKLSFGLGFVPNLYATFAHSETALPDYLKLQARSSSLSKREREVINVVVTAVNDCAYCREVHDNVGRLNGFSAAALADLRVGTPLDDNKLDALANFARLTVASRGHPTPATVNGLLAAGYTEAQIIDAVLQIGDKTIANYLHGVSGVDIDFPPKPQRMDDLLVDEPAYALSG